MKDYVKTFSGVSITTSQWKAHLFDYFGKQPNANEYMRRLGQVDFDEVSCIVCLCEPVADLVQWLYGSGLDLCVNVEYDDSLSKPVSPAVMFESATDPVVVRRPGDQMGPVEEKAEPIVLHERHRVLLHQSERRAR